MKMSSVLLSATLLAVVVATFALDEDFGFDVSEEFEVETDGSSRKLWSNKEITTDVGKTFHLVIPKDAFGKDVQSYKAKQIGGKPLPPWLLFDKTGGVFWGVPLSEDVATLHLVITAIGSSNNNSEEVTVKVIESSDIAAEKCLSTEDNTVLTLLIDKGLRAIKPKQRVIAVNNIAKFFGLPFSAFIFKPQLVRDDITDSSVVLAGPGNLHSRSSKLTSLLQVPVGCDGRLWVQTAPLIHQLKQQARDGTISEVIGLPLTGWRVKTETRPITRKKRQVDDDGSGDYEDYYDDNYDDEDFDDEDSSGDPLEVVPKTSIITSTSTTTIPTPTHPHRHHHGEALSPEDDDFSIPIIREHHQSSSPRIEEETITPVVVAKDTTTTISATTTTTTTEKPTTKEEIKLIPSSSSTTKSREHTTQKIETNPEADYEYEYGDYDDEDEEEDPIESKTIVPDLLVPKQPTSAVTFSTVTPSTTVTSPTTTSTTTERTTIKDFIVETILPTTEAETTPIIVEDLVPSTVVYNTETSPVSSPPPMTTQSATSTASTTITTTTTTTTTPMPTVPTTIEYITTEQDEDTTTVKLTTVRHVFSTPRTTTVREVITEGLEYETKNFSPYIENRLQQMSVIAGKIFRFVVPRNTFKDFEDGYNLTLEFLNSKGEPLSKNSWCHFNPTRREIYGLPLERDVSKWEYVLKATDREGASVTDIFTIQVQQHKQQRAVNHEFSLHMRIEKQQEFPHFVDWCLKTLRALGRIYNTNMSEITVRSVNYTSEPVIFTWTNDSIPTNHCPAAEIDKLFKILTANDRGDPSRELNLLLAPELRVKKVTKLGLGLCETPQVPVTPPTNYPPFLRNQVDHINATVGELLVFKVPEDTFYDPEDTDPRTLNISLLTGDRQPIKPSNWLQFDSKNREFYGIPRKPSRNEYQLVCADNGGLTATDSLEVVVYPAPKIHYNVEFSMAIETPYDTFVNSAALQRKFVEKLQEIFGDRNSSYIHLNPFKPKQNSTIVTWYNKSLNAIDCPHDEITRLESVINNERSISSRVHAIMDPDFPVSTIKVLPVGNCRVVKPVAPAAIPPPEDTAVPLDEKSSEAKSDEFQYLMTFIVPAVIISIMLLLAAIAAFVLYRRRRTGKMNVEEDGRQSYGNKGIPVIFQEELEEKPESGTKAPVILKDEKPPLAPPEYSKSGSLKLTDDSEPYQPPPPFTRTQDNGRQPRPKPTPTYRKPPPYVPP